MSAAAAQADVVIAVRGGPQAKSRCGAVLDGAALAAAMLHDMVDAARSCPQVARVHVVTPTPAIAAGLPVHLIVEPDAAGMNAAFHRACAALPGRTLVLLPGDLPELCSADLAALITAHEPGGITVVPSATDGGTGAVVLAAGRTMRFAFGPGSFARHITQSGARRFDCAGIGDDLDRPQDAVRALARGGPHTRACLASRLNVPPVQEAL